MPEPLRPELYRRLEQRFGSVRIANEGEEMLERIDEQWVIPAPGRRAVVERRLTVLCPGEYYLVSCGFCNDTRHRLWINHRWGLWDPRVRSNNLFLAHCFNEDCLSYQGRARQLYEIVFSDILNGRASRVEDRLNRGHKRSRLPDQVKPPGEYIYPLHGLQPDHPAVEYVRGRGYDPVRLGRDLSVGYCLDTYPEFHAAADRLIIPVYLHGKMVGWQARYLGEPPDARVPKYYTMPGMRKSQLLYNFDAASRSPFVVVCEGVTDVWAFGPEAVALFGKNISGPQTELICATWGQGAVVILLDGDAADEALEVHDALGDRVRRKVIVPLPADKDPGDFVGERLRELVFAAALSQGVDLASLAAGGLP
jgi:hypothetical protein